MINMIRHPILIEGKDSLNIINLDIIDNIIPNSLFTPFLLHVIHQLLIYNTSNMVDPQFLTCVHQLLLTRSTLT